MTEATIQWRRAVLHASTSHSMVKPALRPTRAAGFPKAPPATYPSGAAHRPKRSASPGDGAATTSAMTSRARMCSPGPGPPASDPAAGRTIPH